MFSVIKEILPVEIKEIPVEIKEIPVKSIWVN